MPSDSLTTFAVFFTVRPSATVTVPLFELGPVTSLLTTSATSPPVTKTYVPLLSLESASWRFTSVANASLSDITPASYSFCAMAEPPEPSGMFTVTVLPASMVLPS